MSRPLTLEERFDSVSDVPSLDELTPLQRRFVLHYVLGEDGIRAIASRSYSAACEDIYGHPTTSSSTPATAATTAWMMMKYPGVQKAISDLQRVTEQMFRNRLRSWTEMAVNAQEALHRAVRTIIDPNMPSDEKVFLAPTQLMAIQETLDRALGQSKKVQELEVGDKLEELIKKISSSRAATPLSPAETKRFIGEGRATISPLHIVRDGTDPN